MTLIKYCLGFFLCFQYSLFASDSFKDPLAAVLTASRPDLEGPLNRFLVQIDILEHPYTSSATKEIIKAQINALPNKLELIKEAYVDLESDCKNLSLIASFGADENERSWVFWNNRKELSDNERREARKNLFFLNREFASTLISSEDMAGALFVNCSFHDCSFKGNLENLFIIEGSLIDCRFEQVAISGAAFKNCFVFQTTFSDFNVNNFQFIDMNFESSVFRKSNFESCCFSGGELLRIGFFEFITSYVEFNEVDLDNVCFTKNSGNLDFTSLRFKDVIFDESNISNLKIGDIIIVSLNVKNSKISKIIFDKYLESPTTIETINLDRATLSAINSAPIIEYVNRRKVQLEFSKWLNESPLGRNFAKALEGEPLSGHKRSRENLTP